MRRVDLWPVIYGINFCAALLKKKRYIGIVLSVRLSQLLKNIYIFQYRGTYVMLTIIVFQTLTVRLDALGSVPCHLGLMRTLSGKYMYTTGLNQFNFART